jgi:CDP-paratose 2-epimerase
MRILVTGGAGLVGSHAAEYFANKNKHNKIIIIDNLFRSRLFGQNKKSVEYNWRYLSKYSNITRILGDIRSESDLRRAIGKGVDVVIHAAGQPGVPTSISNPRIDFETNALGTFNVLEQTRKKSKNAIAIYCSTNKVYGENIDRIPLQETKSRYYYRNVKGIDESMSTDMSGHTPYGVSKLAGDLYVQEYGRLYKMRTTVFRMSCIYGIRQFGFEDQGWVAWFIIATLLKKTIRIFGNGKQVRDLLYVTDLIRAFEACINKPTLGEVFNIGGGLENNISLLEFMRLLSELSGLKTRVTFSDWRLSDQKVYISDTSKFNSMFGWEPLVDKKTGINLLYSWVKENLKFFK